MSLSFEMTPPPSRQRQLSIPPPMTFTSEEEFQAIGLTSIFDTEDDDNVDWEEVFDVKFR